jgi:hypothetical protein
MSFGRPLAGRTWECSIGGPQMLRGVSSVSTRSPVGVQSMTKELRRLLVRLLHACFAIYVPIGSTLRPSVCLSRVIYSS